jgi:DNA repair protein RadC
MLTPEQPPSTPLIRDLPAMERPRERLRAAGAAALSHQELVAILLRTGSARQSAIAQAGSLVRQFKSLSGIYRASFDELCAVPGLGEAKAAQLKAALELGLRLAREAPEERTLVRSAEDVANLLRTEMSLLDQESVRCVMLDTRMRVMGIEEVHRGSVHTTHVRIAEVFRPAIRANATHMVLVHNHPSGDPTPSAPDITLTKGIIEAGKLMDIELQDHIVIAGGRYVSMREARIAFPLAGPSMPPPVSTNVPGTAGAAAVAAPSG